MKSESRWSPPVRMRKSTSSVPSPAAIASEDSGFCAHHGFEWEAIRNAWYHNQRSSRIRGGSTISNQTAINEKTRRT